MLTFADELINKKKSVDLIPIPEKSVVEKPTHNPCKDLPTCDIACQDIIPLSQAEFVDPKFPGKSIETTSSTSTLGGQQNKDKGAGCASTGLTGLQTGLTTSSKVLQNK